MPAAHLSFIDFCSAYVTKAAGQDWSRVQVSTDRLMMRNVTLNDTASILCNASNDYGHVLTSVYLNVYGKY